MGLREERHRPDSPGYFTPKGRFVRNPYYEPRFTRISFSKPGRLKYEGEWLAYVSVTSDPLNNDCVFSAN